MPLETAPKNPPTIKAKGHIDAPPPWYGKTNSVNSTKQGIIKQQIIQEFNGLYFNKYKVDEIIPAKIITKITTYSIFSAPNARIWGSRNAV